MMRTRPNRSPSTPKNSPPAAPPSRKAARPRFACQSIAAGLPPVSSRQHRRLEDREELPFVDVEDPAGRRDRQHDPVAGAQSFIPARA